MSTEARYSGTPLPQKLGLKDGQAVAFVGLPIQQDGLARACAFRFVTCVPGWRDVTGAALDVVHLFTRHAEDVTQGLPVLRRLIQPTGMIWVSWPKRASGVVTDLTEDVIRAAALRDVLVDVKVCAVDAVWSGLKLVIRKEHRV